MLAKSILSIAACALLMSVLLPAVHAAQEEDSSAGKQAEKQFTVELDPETFDLAIAGNNVFVKFFAPWCGHCKRLQPLWEQVAEIMNVEDSKVIIAKVDCTKHQTLCGTHQVTGYPTLRLFKLGEDESVKFKGTRDLPAITDFINQELNTPADADLVEAVKREEVGENPNLGKVVDLTEDTFAKHVSSGNHFVKFFAPWCGHCQKLAPIWETLAKELVEQPAVTVSKIDCTQFRSICQDFEVKGYPTLLWIEDGKKIEKYSGSRDLSTLKTYVEKMVGVPAEQNAEKKATGKEAAKKENLGKVVDLTEDTFAKHVSSGNHFVKFFAPWCSHCQHLAPIWETLAKELVEQPAVTISKIDCTQFRSICQDFEVKGYPTLLWIEDGKKIEKYSGSRDLSTLKTYVEKMVGVPLEKNAEEKASGEEAAKKENLGKVVDLTEDTFAKHVSSGNHFIKFFAPWCSHCQHLAPIWETLAKELVEESALTVSKIDCTQFRSICQDFEVKGYPTLLWIEDGKKIDEYSGSRDLSTLKTYVEKMVGLPLEKNGEEKASGEEAAKKEEAAAEKEAAAAAAKKLTAQQLSGEAEFDESIADGVAFIKFYAPWCGHCQKLQPTWEQLATETHQAHTGVKIAKVDCTAPENKQVCIDQQVEGYPTLFLYKNGQRQNEYEGSRSLPELQAYLKKFLGHDEL